MRARRQLGQMLRYPLTLYTSGYIVYEFRVALQASLVPDFSCTLAFQCINASA